MKHFAILALTLATFSAWAQFSKPELIARLSSVNAWNAPDNMWCFTGEPGVLQGKIYLGCLDEGGYLMGQWSGDGFKILARAGHDQFFSYPQNSFNKISWYEYNEWGVLRSFENTSGLRVIKVPQLSRLNASHDSLLPVGSESWIYRIKGDAPEIWIWRNNEVVPFFNPGAAYIYTPHTGPQGEVAFKTREINYDESSPDRLWIYNGAWKVVLEDRDANPDSPWLKFRHQLSVEGSKVLVIASDKEGEALLLIDGERVQILARTGIDLKSFDHFSPKMRSGTILARGVDFQGLKATYVYDQSGFRKLLSQGDIVKTDLGLARVHYQNSDSIFYGAPGIDEHGNVVLQATLTDADHPSTLLGIGIVKFTKE